MRKKKIYEFCKRYPIIPVAQRSIDLIASNAFDLERDFEYVQSNTVEARYGAPVREKFKGLQNEFIDDFDKLGANEKYLMNAFFYSSAKLLYLLGGVGTGKTRLLKYFAYEIFPRRKHICVKDCGKTGRIIYIDF